MTTAQLVYPDVVGLVRTYLAAQLPALAGTYPEATGADVVVREPDPFVAPVVRVRRSGGVDDYVVTDRPRVDLIVWHATESQAVALANLCRAVMFGLPGVRAEGSVLRVLTFSGPASIWDDDRNLPRILLSFEVSTRGVSL